MGLEDFSQENMTGFKRNAETERLREEQDFEKRFHEEYVTFWSNLVSHDSSYWDESQESAYA